MALLFNGTTSYLQLQGNIASAFPLSYFVRFKPNPFSQTAALVSTGVNGAGFELSILQVSSVLRGTSRDATLASSYAVTANGTNSSWHTAMAAFVSTVMRKVKLDTGTLATNNYTSNFPIATADRFSVGMRGFANVPADADSLMFAGEIAELAVWSSELSSTDYDAILAGALPETVSTGTLIDVWPLLTQGATQVGIVNGTVLTAYNTAQGGAHPVTRTVSADATATGGTGTGIGSGTGGNATGGSGGTDATATGGTGTGTGSGSGGNAVGGSTGSFTAGPIENNAGSLWLNQPVAWTWTPDGRVGSKVGKTPIDGTGTTHATTGVLVATGLPAGTGQLDIAILGATAADDLVYQEYGTVT